MGRVNVHYTQPYFQTEAVAAINPSDTVFMAVKPSTNQNDGYCLEMTVNGNTDTLGQFEEKAFAVDKMKEILDAMEYAEKSDRTTEVRLGDSSEKKHNIAKRQESIGLD